MVKKKHVGRLGSVRAVGLVGHGNLAFQHRCVVGTGLIEQENIGDGRGVKAIRYSACLYV